MNPIVAVNDLFIWGVFIGLMEAAGVQEIEATLRTKASDAPFVLWGAAPASPQAALPSTTHTLVLTGRAPDRRLSETAVANLDTRTIRAQLAALLQRDLLETWNVTDAARRLGMSRRSLQRALRAEETTFSEVVHCTRIDAAQALMPNTRLTLTDIAFCVGFADQGHFTRTFRRFCDVPPSAFREILPV